MWCNGTETCDPITGCQSGTGPNCNDSVDCTTDACDEAADSCTHAASNAACDDANVCNGLETCDQVSGCQPGTPLTCDDGLWCSGAETCEPITGCQPGTAPNCNDGVACTTDACDEAIDSCTHVANNAACDDANVCNGLETCDPVTGCQPGTPITCDDANVCTTDTCDPITGCGHVNNMAPCNDGISCTSNDACAGGVCSGQGNCPAGQHCDTNLNTCTADSSTVLLPNDVRSCQGSRVMVPVTVDPVSGALAMDLAFTFDPAVLRAVEVQKSSLTAEMSLTYNLAMPGKVDISLFGPDPLSGGGAVAWVVFEAIGATGSSTALHWIEHRINEDEIPTTADDGSVSVTAGQVSLSLPKDVVGVPGGHVVVPVTSTPRAGIGIDLTVRFDAAVLQVAGVTKATGIPTGFVLNYSTATPGEVRISLFGTVSLTGSGPIVNIDFLVLGSIGDSSALDLARGMIDEGSIATCLSDGLLGVCATNCSDGNACNGSEICSAGECVPGSPPACDDGNVCTTDSCNPATGCVYANNTAPCDDGNACTTNDTCSGGSCQGGAAVVCSDGNVCTDDSCNPATGCVYTNNTAPCNDGNACTTSDTCSGGTCTGGTALVCNDGNVCTDDSCNPATGCVYTNNAAPCSDGNPCTTGDTCSGGTCVGGAALVCNDGNVCTDDSCSPATGCVYTNNAAPCEDGSTCTTGDSCSNGTCQPGAGLICNDGNPCTDDGCSPATGCVYTNNTAPCSDGNACTTGDTCGGGSCQPGTTVVCNDGNVCTDDSCNPATGCVYTGNTAPCNDGNSCTTDDTCSGGSCQGGTALVCNDGNVCTDDSCNPATGCVHTNNTAPCDDGNPCTTNDTCSTGTCVGGTAVVCNDGNACTDDTCNPASGCVYTPDDTNGCSDGSTCNGSETCHSGTCQPGTPVNCSGLNGQCVVGVCVEPAGTCQAQPANEGGSCNDGIACTGNDRCTAGACAGEPNCPTGQHCDQSLNTCVADASTVSLPDDIRACPDSRVIVPVTVSPATGVLAMDLAFTYDPAVLRAVEVQQTSFTAAMSLTYNLALPGKVDISLFGSSPLSGSGTVAWVVFDAIGAVGSTTALHWVEHQLNENEVPSAADDGSASVVAAQVSLSVPTDVVGVPGSHVIVPVSSTPRAGIGIDLTVQFDAAVLQVAGVTKAAGIPGTFTLNYNSATPGEVRISLFGTVPLTGSGPIVNIDFLVIGSVGASSPLHLSRGLIDEGAIATCLADGRVNLCATTCDDGNACTSDSCSAGVCEHVARVGATCDDGNVCTTADTCDAAGQCVGGTALVCNDGNACTDDSCNPASGCVYTNNTSPCDDGNACTTNDACSGGTCTGGTALVCDDGNVCTDDSCNPATGCVYANNTAPCSDGSACTTDDTCSGGTCVGGTALVCNDGNVCTDDSCNPATGCVYTNNTAPCSDGNACTTNDTCSGGTCVGGTALVCNDGNACTDDSCNPASGCVYTNNTSPCDDGNACTTNDACSGGTCTGGTALVCDDGNVCTDDSCNPATGCVYTNNTAPCDDGTVCNGHEVCGGGTCQAGTALVCNDGLYCNGVETCDPSLGCGPGTPVNCDDGVACTLDACNETTDSCTHTPQNALCNDGNPCTDDSCDAQLGCVAVNDDTNACNDGNVCTESDHCESGVCVGTPVPVPAEVLDLMLTGKSATALTWGDQGGVHYDVAAGAVGDLVADDGVGAAACLADNASISAWIDARPAPSAGEGYYYLVRAQNACQPGTWGYGSNGTERTPTNACP